MTNNFSKPGAEAGLPSQPERDSKGGKEGFLDRLEGVTVAEMSDAVVAKVRSLAEDVKDIALDAVDGVQAPFRDFQRLVEMGLRAAFVGGTMKFSHPLSRRESRAKARKFETRLFSLENYLKNDLPGGLQIVRNSDVPQFFIQNSAGQQVGEFIVHEVLDWHNYVTDLYIQLKLDGKKPRVLNPVELKFAINALSPPQTSE